MRSRCVFRVTKIFKLSIYTAIFILKKKKKGKKGKRKKKKKKKKGKKGKRKKK